METALLTLILFFLIFIVLKLIWKDQFNKQINLARLVSGDYAVNRRLKELLFEETPYAVVATDGFGKVLMCNARFKKKFGWTEEEMIGKNISIIIPERFKKMHELGMQRYRDSGESVLVNNDDGIEVIGLHKDGHEFPVHLKLKLINDGGFKTLGAYIRNITKDKAKEKVFTDKIDLLEKGEKCAEIGSWYWQLLDNEKKLVQVSPNFYEVFDVDENKTVTSDLLMELVYYKDRLSTAAKINQAIENRENYSTTYRRLLSNGSLRLVEVRGCLIFNEENDVIAISGTIQTIENGVDGS